MLIRTFILFFICFTSMSVVAKQRTLPIEVASVFIELTQANFWGNARGENGDILQLPAGTDPKEAIIPREDALNVVEASVLVGRALSCGVRWDHYYLSYMKIERGKNKWTETQIAFIGLLFGVSQNQISKALEGSCTPEIHSQIQQQMGVRSDA